MIAETHGTGGSRRRLAVPPALRLRRPRRRRGPTPTSSSTAAAPGPCGPRAIPRAAPSWKRPWTTWPTSSGSTRWSSGSRTSPPDDFQHADLRGRGQDRGRADRLARTASRAARTARGRSSAASAWPCTSGAAAAPQDKQVTCTINPDGSVEVKTRHPGHRHRHPDDPGDHRRRGARPASRPTSSRTSATRPSRRARPRAARPPRRRWPRRAFDAVTKARDALFEKIAPGLKAEPEDLSLKDGKVLVKGEPKMSLEGRLPQARHDADLRDRRASPTGLVQRRRRRLPVRRGDGRHRDRRRPGQEDRRHPGLGPDHRQADLGEPGLRRRHRRPELRPVRGADHGPDDGRDAQPRHGAVQARRRRPTSPRSSSRRTSPTSRRPAA